MKSLSTHLNESLQIVEASIAYSKSEMLEKIKSEEFKTFDDIEEGDEAQRTSEPDEIYTIIKKYNNIDTARANIPDIDDMLKGYSEDIEVSANFASSLPVVLVQHNDNQQVFVYAPEKADAVETLVVFKS